MWIQHLFGWTGQGHSIPGEMGLTRRGCSCCRQGRGGGSLDPAPSCYPVPWRILKKAEGAVCEFKCEVSVCPLSHRAAFCKREERFWVYSCKFGSKLSMLWEVVLCSSCAGLFHPTVPELAVPFQKQFKVLTVSSLNCGPTSSVFGSPFLWKYSSFPS